MVNTMIDLQTIEANLIKAKEDVAFWEKAKAVFLDPRITAIGAVTLPSLNGRMTPPPQRFSMKISPPRPYGELKRKVQEYIYAYGGHEGLSNSEIANGLEASGYVFQSKVPSIAVNEALTTLAAEDPPKAILVGTRGLSKLWRRGESQEPAEAGS